MLKLGFSKSLSEWIGSNLKKSGEQETWAFNLDGAVQMFSSYRWDNILYDFLFSITYWLFWNMNDIICIFDLRSF